VIGNFFSNSINTFYLIFYLDVIRLSFIDSLVDDNTLKTCNSVTEKEVFCFGAVFTRVSKRSGINTIPSIKRSLLFLHIISY